ncbi:hypothetical protein NC652_015024 [Populus alba x Populus x berolinensis]|nr:hypothetical protein NC652_015024 [Populus alba x Populus x berolinensis]
MGFGLPWLGFLDLTWVLQDLGLFIFYNRWVLHDLVLNKCGCARLPAGYVGGYCSGSVGLDVFGLWEIRWFVLCSGLVSSLSFKGAGCVYSGIQNQWLLFYNWKKLCACQVYVLVTMEHAFCDIFERLVSKKNCSRGFEVLIVLANARNCFAILGI